MNYTRENLPKNQVKFTFKVEGEQWKNAIKKAYEKTKHQFDVEGFRKGKVPQKVVESKYGPGIFFEDALDIILPDSYSYALDNEKEVIPVARPEIELIAISDTEAKFAIIVTVKPEIKLGSYTGIKVKKVVKTVTEEDINKQIKEAQERAGSWEDITGRAIINGDTIDLNYSGMVDGIKFDGGTAENQSLVIGSGSFIPGFEEQLIGLNIGDEKDITVKFPEDYNAEQLSGKNAVFAVKINGIKVKVLPEIDDEFAKDVSESDTLVAYKADLTKNLQESYNESAENEMANSIIDKVIENSEMEVPDAMIESQIDDMVQEFTSRLQYQGMKIEDYFKYTGMKMEDLRKQYTDMALKNIKVRLVLDAIVKKEKFTTSDAECDEKIKIVAKEYKKEYEEFKKTVTAEQMDYFKNLVVSDKIFTFLKNNNTFTD